jgi:hypothetical protein
MNEVRLRDLLLLLITSVGCLASNTGGAEVEASSAGSADRETCDGLMNRFFAFAEGKEAAATSISKGRWEVTEITGVIRDWRPAPGLPDVCPAFESSRGFLADDPETFIKLSDIGGKSIFVASFGLGQGNYMGNRGIEAHAQLESESTPEAEQARTLMKDFMKLLPKMMKEPTYQGVWDDSHVVACFMTETDYSDTASGRDYGQGEGGFLVWGQFEGPNRLVGEWQVVEHGHAPAAEACCTYGYGRGTWAAHAP